MELGLRLPEGGGVDGGGGVRRKGLQVSPNITGQGGEAVRKAVRDGEDGAGEIFLNIRRRSATYPMDSHYQKQHYRPKTKVYNKSIRFYSVSALIIYSLCLLVVITIFNAFFLSKLTALVCSVANFWNFSFLMC